MREELGVHRLFKVKGSIALHIAVAVQYKSFLTFSLTRILILIPTLTFACPHLFKYPSFKSVGVGGSN